MSYHSMEEMFKNLGNVISKQIIGSFATVIKLGLDDYDKLDVKVGDRVSLEIQRKEVAFP